MLYFSLILLLPVTSVVIFCAPAPAPMELPSFATIVAVLLNVRFFIHIFSPHTSINFSYIQKGCSNRYSPVVAAELSLLHVTVLDSGFATLCFHKCALMVNNFIEFAHFCQYIFFIHTDVI